MDGVEAFGDVISPCRAHRLPEELGDVVIHLHEYSVLQIQVVIIRACHGALSRGDTPCEVDSMLWSNRRRHLLDLIIFLCHSLLDELNYVSAGGSWSEYCLDPQL